MPRVVVPVRYPLTTQSRQTLEKAVSLAGEREADLTVLHVDLFHNNKRVSRRQLRRACERYVDGPANVNYVVRQGLLVEETILEEIAAEDANVVVIGKAQVGRWRRMVRRLLDDPDIERFLQEELDCEVVTVPTD